MPDLTEPRTDDDEVTYDGDEDFYDDDDDIQVTYHTWFKTELIQKGLTL